MSKKLINIIEMGPHQVPVFAVEGLVELASCYGMAKPGVKGYEILIDADLDPAQAGETYLHELVELSLMMRDFEVPHQVIQTLGIDLAQALGLQVKIDESVAEMGREETVEEIPEGELN